jgi:hypothetical protein
LDDVAAPAPRALSLPFLILLWPAPLKPLIWTKGIPLETDRTANPVQTTAFFGVEKGFFGEGVDGGNP